MAVVIALMLFVGTATAQTTIAYIDSETLIQDMAEYKKANIDLETFGKQLEAQLKIEQEKFQKEYGAVVDSIQKGIMSPLLQQQAEARLQKKEQKLQAASQDAQKKIKEKEAELFKPINDKFSAALKKIAVANGYAYIVDKKVFLYLDGGVDATEKVKTELLGVGTTTGTGGK